MAKKQESRKSPASVEVEKTRNPKSTSVKSTKSDNAGTEPGKTHEKRAKEFTVRAHGKRSKEASNTASVKSRKPKGKIKDKRTDGAGVTENAPYSDLAKYRMVTTSDDVVNSSGS